MHLHPTHAGVWELWLQFLCVLFLLSENLLSCTICGLLKHHWTCILWSWSSRITTYTYYVSFFLAGNLCQPRKCRFTSYMLGPEVTTHINHGSLLFFLSLHSGNFCQPRKCRFTSYMLGPKSHNTYKPWTFAPLSLSILFAPPYGLSQNAKNPWICRVWLEKILYPQTMDLSLSSTRKTFPYGSDAHLWNATTPWICEILKMIISTNYGPSSLAFSPKTYSWDRMCASKKKRLVRHVWGGVALRYKSYGSSHLSLKRKSPLNECGLPKKASGPTCVGLWSPEIQKLWSFYLSFKSVLYGSSVCF